MRFASLCMPLYVSCSKNRILFNLPPCASPSPSFYPWLLLKTHQTAALMGAEESGSLLISNRSNLFCHHFLSELPPPNTLSSLSLSFSCRFPLSLLASSSSLIPFLFHFVSLVPKSLSLQQSAAMVFKGLGCMLLSVSLVCASVHIFVC